MPPAGVRMRAHADHGGTTRQQQVHRQRRGAADAKLESFVNTYRSEFCAALQVPALQAGLGLYGFATRQSLRRALRAEYQCGVHKLAELRTLNARRRCHDLRHWRDVNCWAAVAPLPCSLPSAGSVDFGGEGGSFCQVSIATRGTHSHWVTIRLHIAAFVEVVLCMPCAPGRRHALWRINIRGSVCDTCQGNIRGYGQWNGWPHCARRLL